MTSVTTFVSRAELTADQNLQEFVRLCRDDLKEPAVAWADWKWVGFVQFTRLTAPKKVGDPRPHMLHPDFIEFAKAYIRYGAARFQSDSRSPDQTRMTALRALEHALLKSTGSASLKGVNLTVFNVAAQALRDKFKGKQLYTYGLALTALAKFLGTHRLCEQAVHTWRSGIRSPRNESRAVGADADAIRLRKLPDPDVLRAIADRFGRGFDLADPDCHKDIYTTSCVAMLLSAPMRGTELHNLAVDLEKADFDELGQAQYGWRVRAAKGFGWQIKWIPEVWVPIAKEAVGRLRAITEDSRKLARYLEAQWEERAKNPHAKLRFYRHSQCPAVADDEPLDGKQVCAALGFAGLDSLRDSKFDNTSKFTSRRGAYTLNDLAEWVFSVLPQHFPYTDETKQLKYSDALMCMRYKQMHASNETSPVRLYLPALYTLLTQLRGGSDSSHVVSFFERHGYRDQAGNVLRARSHQFRHFLNTAAHIGSNDAVMTQEDIDLWSGRTRFGAVYDHEPAEDKARKLSDALRRDDGSHAAIGNPVATLRDAKGEQTLHWVVQLGQRHKPVSCEDLDLVPRGANQLTLYGMCEHDFMFNPCEKFGDCLNCNEHHCIKGAGKTQAEQLVRIKALLEMVMVEEEQAAAAAQREDPGAAHWYDTQRAQREKLQQLVSILEDPLVADGSIVRLSDASLAKSHLHRVLSRIALSALENNTAPAAVMHQLLSAVTRDEPSELAKAGPLRLH